MTTPLLKIALLGDDPAAIAWLRALAHAAPRWAELIFAAGLHPVHAAELARSFPNALFSRDWTDLLAMRDVEGRGASESPGGSSDLCDVVLLAGAAPLHLEGAKRLVSEGKSLVVFPCPEQESAFAYEMSLIRDDTHALLLPVFPDRESPAVRELKRRLDAGELGRVLQIEFDREIPVATAAGELPLLNRSTIRTELLADVDLIRFLGGRYDQVTAILSNVDAAGLVVDGMPPVAAEGARLVEEESISPSATLGDEPAAKDHKRKHPTDATRRDILRAEVTLSGTNRPKGIWTLKPLAVERAGEARAGATLDSRWRVRSAMRVTVTTEKGIARLHQRLDALLPTLSIAGQDVKTGDAGEEATGVFKRVVELLRRGVTGEKVSPDWSDLTQALETVEAGERSVRRRRTIDLYFETTSERSQFKTQMAAMGCGVLMWTLMGVIGLLLVGAVPGVPTWLMHVIRAVVFLPLFVFLILQLLLLIARPSRSATETPPC